MATFATHAALALLQATHFKHRPDMYPADYGSHYRSLPVVLPGGTVTHVKVDSYKSTYTADRKKACNAFLSAARKFCDAPATRDANALDWMSAHQSRVVSCFAGQGLPEEISLICALAVASGHKKADALPGWASTNFGMDCVGFVSSYLVALGSFDKMVAYIPSYKTIAGAATRIDDIRYDNMILWADLSGGKAKIRPNPGNSSHIAIIECWETYGSTVYVAQSASSKSGVDYDRIYEIVEPPKSTDPAKAIWKLRAKGGSSFEAVVTKTVPAYSATG